MELKRLTPMINVSDIERSLEFYRLAVGFKLRSSEEAVEDWRWAEIESGNCALMLSESEGPLPELANIDTSKDHGWPVIFYFNPDDVVALREHCQSLGLKVGDLRVTYYG